MRWLYELCSVRLSCPSQLTGVRKQSLINHGTMGRLSDCLDWTYISLERRHQLKTNTQNHKPTDPTTLYLYGTISVNINPGKLNIWTDRHYMTWLSGLNHKQPTNQMSHKPQFPPCRCCQWNTGASTGEPAHPGSGQPCPGGRLPGSPAVGTATTPSPDGPTPAFGTVFIEWRK